MRSAACLVLNRVQFENHDSVCPTVTLIKERNYDFQTRRGLARIIHEGDGCDASP